MRATCWSRTRRPAPSSAWRCTPATSSAASWPSTDRRGSSRPRAAWWSWPPRPGPTSWPSSPPGSGRRGSRCTNLDGGQLRDHEPHLSPALRAGAFYPQDAQVQPMLMAAHLLRLARDLGAGCRPAPWSPGSCAPATRSPGSQTSAGAISAGRGDQRRRPLGGSRRRARRGVAADPAAPRVRAGHRAAAAHHPPQGLRGRVRGQRAQLRRGPADLPGRGEHGQRARC